MKMTKEIGKEIKPVIVKNGLTGEDFDFYARINKSSDHIPTGDILVVGDDQRQTHYVVFSGRVMHNYWIDRGNRFETIDFMGDKKTILKSQCLIAE